MPTSPNPLSYLTKAFTLLLTLLLLSSISPVSARQATECIPTIGCYNTGSGHVCTAMGIDLPGCPSRTPANIASANAKAQQHRALLNPGSTTSPKQPSSTAANTQVTQPATQATPSVQSPAAATHSSSTQTPSAETRPVAPSAPAPAAPPSQQPDNKSTETKTHLPWWLVMITGLSGLLLGSGLAALPFLL